MLNEQQLITASNETYLPNTSGLITAQRVRDFNNDDLIPTIFDISASLQNTINGIVAGTGFVTTQSFNTYTSSQTAESASFNGRVDALQTSTASLNLYTQSINAFTQSTNVFTSSYSTGSFTGSFSGDGSKLFGITASGAGVGILDEGIFQGAAVTLNFTGSSISASVVGGIATINVTPTNVSMFLSKSTFETYTASLDLTFATDASLSASASTLQDNINTLSSSVAVTDLAQSSSIAQLLTFSSSLDSTYATDTQLSASASTLQNNINTRLLTSSFNTYTASIVLGNYVTTASFNAYTASDSSNTSASINAATQSLSSSLATGISASIASVSASLTLTDNSKLESSSFNSYTASAATNTTASINAATQSLSASLSTGISASISQLSASTAGQLSTASFNSYTASASTNVSASINAATSSLSSSLTLTDNSKLNSASFNLFTASALLTSSGWASTGSNTFIGNQIISGNLDVTGKITALSASITYLETIFETASVIYSSGSNQLGDELSDVQTLSGSVKVQGGLTVNGVPVQTSSFDASGYLLTSSFNTYTQSAASNTSASINSATSSLSQSLSASIGELSASVAAINSTQLSTSSFNTYTASASTNVSGAINAATSSLSSSLTLTDNSKLNTASFNTYTASAATNVSASINSATSSLSASLTTTINGISSKTGSYITSAQTASMTVLSASFAQTASFAFTSSVTQQVSTSISSQNLQHNVLFVDTTGPGFVQVDGGLRYNPNTDLLTTTASLAITASYALNVTPTDVSMFVSQSTFNTYTSSEASNVSASINSATSSLSASLTLTDNSKLNTASFNSFTASVITTGSSATTQNITGALNVSGNFTVVEQFPTINTNNTFFTSTGSTQLDLSIVRAGGGTNDVTNLRLQAISGSNTTDTVQSQLLVGNNNNTATFFSSSASINLSTVFATGSMGGRVSYSANVSVNAFSGSANVAITAPIVRMGQAGAQIAITGSNPTILSGSLSGSLVSTLTDIYPSTPQGNFIVTIDSASMATLIAGAGTNANTLYFVI
jgi:hypothetical protein